MTATTMDTVLSTAESMAPSILSAGLAIAGATSPQGAAIVALAPIAMKLLDSAIQLQKAGAMTPEELAQLFATVGRGIADTHAQWAAMDAADAAKAAAVPPAA